MHLITNEFIGKRGVHLEEGCSLGIARCNWHTKDSVSIKIMLEWIWVEKMELKKGCNLEGMHLKRRDIFWLVVLFFFYETRLHFRRIMLLDLGKQLKYFFKISPYYNEWDSTN